jgi:hypothetical protein
VIKGHIVDVVLGDDVLRHPLGWVGVEGLPEAADRLLG